MIVFELLSGERITIEDAGEERAFLAATSGEEDNLSFFVHGVRYFVRCVAKVIPAPKKPPSALRKRERGRPRTRFTLA